jgi:hypothetical protein
MAQVNRLYNTKEAVKTIHVDLGYRGHNYKGPAEVLVDKRRRGETPKRIWQWMKRRAAVESTISHLKAAHRLEGNRLRGLAGRRAQRHLERRRHELREAVKLLFGPFVPPARRTRSGI